MIIGFIKSNPNLNLDLFPNANSLIGGYFGFIIIWLIFLFIKNKTREWG